MLLRTQNAGSRRHTAGARVAQTVTFKALSHTDGALLKVFPADQCTKKSLVKTEFLQLYLIRQFKTDQEGVSFRIRVREESLDQGDR